DPIIVDTRLTEMSIEGVAVGLIRGGVSL
ncbi:MAG: hypothetical protein QG660_1103, partial [Pseudomonadota bacterium]|nr:hypothetical protein [Pseudomonadota bacterium]